MKQKDAAIRNLVVISDTHCGCRMGLCPPRGVRLADGGGTYKPSNLQKVVWKWWSEFWDEWVPRVTRGEPYVVVVNGDAMDGSHHRSKTQISQNHADQQNIAYECLAPVRGKCKDFYMIGGTEAHAGSSWEYEEMLAERLNAIPDSNGARVRPELWKWVGDYIVHLTHHIGVTGSSHYESSAVMRELSESYVEAGRWGDRPPDAIVRSHRHRDFEIKIPARDGYALGLVTGSWQLKTPFVAKVPGGRVSQPQIGGLMVRAGDEENLYARHHVMRLSRPEVV